MKSKYRTFGLSVILSVTAVVAAMLVGYRSGFEKGIIDREATTVSTRSYYVGPLVNAADSAPNQTADYSQLITLITTTVLSDSWGTSGGSIKVEQQNDSLLVSQTARVHSELDRFFKMLVRLNRLTLHKDLKSVDTQLKGARDHAEDLAIASGSPERLLQVANVSMMTIENKITQLAELASDLSRGEAALKSGREACLEYARLLESDNGGETRPGSMKISDNSDEFYAQSAKITVLAPERVIQRHVVRVKQQFGDLRSSLSSDLAIYRRHYEDAVKFEAARATVQKLASQKKKLVWELDYCNSVNGPFLGRGRPRHGSSASKPNE